MCQFGSPHKKPTRLVFWNFIAPTLEQRCQGSRGVCSKSLRPHVEITGKDPISGQFRSALAAQYPLGFAQALIAEVRKGVTTVD